VKNRAYFMRYQVKFRRRRECKTDYYARRRLILNDKNKYKTPKYRMVVRFTNRDIIAQIVSADLDHDNVLASAYSHELQNYGVNCGLRNYAAAYATGLLLARRVNQKYNLAEIYEGNVEADADLGEEFHVEQEGDRAPFKALLDVGLKRTTTGARLFGALKGACDGGLNVPHNSRRFPGTKKEDGEYVPNAETHREYIFGGHVGKYMSTLAEEGTESCMFSQYQEAGVDADGLEDMYKNLHAAIRKDPSKAANPLQKGYFAKREKAVKAGTEHEKKFYRAQRTSKAQKMARVKAKLHHQGCKKLV